MSAISSLTPIQSISTTQTVCVIYEQLRTELSNFEKTRNLSTLLGVGKQFDVLTELVKRQNEHQVVLDKMVACIYVLAILLYQNSDDKKGTLLLLKNAGFEGDLTIEQTIFAIGFLERQVELIRLQPVLDTDDLENTLCLIRYLKHSLRKKEHCRDKHEHKHGCKHERKHKHEIKHEYEKWCKYKNKCNDKQRG